MIWQLARRLGAGLVFLVAVRLVFGLSLPNLVNGIALGSLYGIVGVGLVLIYRTTRVINFAAAAVGAVPALFALLLVVQYGVNYLLVLPIVVIGGVGFGVLTDLVVMRRFARAPRLIVTVVTIGVAQTYAGIGIFLPALMGAKDGLPPGVATPWGELSVHNGRGQPVLSGNQVFALAVVISITAGLAMFLRRTRLGIALRASAENADRAALLGIPVKRIGTLSWGLAGLLSALAVFAQAPLIGVPSDATLGFDTLLYGLAAAVVARMDSIGLSLYTGIGIGILIFESIAATGTNNLASALMLVVILLGLLLQRGQLSRALDAGVATWQSVKSFRPVPSELRDLAVVNRARFLLYGLTVAIVVALPFVVGAAKLPLLTLLPLWGIVALSLVILTGWAGQISLGQFGLVGAGGAVAGGVIAGHNIDFFAALAIGAAVGALAALLIGLPAVRIQGLYLAVTTLAFGYAMQNYVLNRNYWIGRHILPTSLAAQIRRPRLYGRIDLEDNRNYFFACVVILALCLTSALSFRARRSGRVLIAMRDNQRAAASYAVNPVRTRLAAFAVSGGFAGLAGVLFVYLQHAVIAASFGPVPSIAIFLAACIAGLTSLYVAVTGVVLFEALVLFLPNLYASHTTLVAIMPLVLTGPLLLLNLALNPGGLSEAVWDPRQLAPAGREAQRADGAVAAGRPEGFRIAAVGPGPGERMKLRRAAETSVGTEPPTAFLSCRGIDAGYDKVQILFGVDLDVAEGEIVALLGTNGAGKSTLLRAISGLLRPTAGSIRLAGRELVGADPGAIAAMGVVQVPGGKAVFPTLTVAEHFRAGCWLFAAEQKAETAARIEAVLDMFPRLRERWGQLAGNLSGGEQQQLALGMAFVAKPKLLIIDELSLGLAPAIVGQLLDIVREIHRQGCTIILVEQSVNVALTIATRAFFMEKGEVRFSGPTAELLDRDDILRSVFLEGAVAKDPARKVAGPARTPNAPLLSVEGLSRSFGGISAVSDVSFCLHEGQILGLIGPNGAGKTTIFDLISGHLDADAGRLTLGGIDITNWGPDRRAAIGLGRSFQDARIFPSLTVAENIAMGLERHIDVRDHFSSLFGTPALRDSEEDVAYTVDDLIELMGLGGYRDKFVSELSTGSRRVVDLAMSIAHDPRVLLLDEPSSGIAQREAEALGPLLLRIRDETGCGILIIEHDMPLIQSVSDHILALDLGRVLLEADPATVMSDPVVVASYLGGDPATIARSGRER
ncbi:MAG: ATP-binding cassette domain-containing protein [Actinomycetota bacterium]|nr:ATP-binding cassette domain-containing protein [Actinomycetota bacterium]